MAGRPRLRDGRSALGIAIDDHYPGVKALQDFQSALQSRGIEVTSREIFNWRVGKHYPDPKIRPGVALLLERDSIDDLCEAPGETMDRRPYHRRLLAQKRSLYQFGAAPRVVMSSWKLADNTYGPHAADLEAYSLIARDLQTLGVHVDYPVISRDPSCPPGIACSDLILICGPNGNELAKELNNLLSNASMGAFYFKNTVPDPSPDLNAVGDQWVISHSVFKELSIALPEKTKDDLVIDYGIVYIGPNPASSRHRLIWVAGLGSHGTPGGARALVDSDMQSPILRRLNTDEGYVSVVVKSECEKDYKTNRTVKLLFAK
jgi:hypothetical protein